MTLLAMIDYGLIALFFVGIAGLLLLVLLPVNRDTRKISSMQGRTPSQKQIGAYAVLAVVFLLLVALTVLAQRERPPGSASI